MSNLIVYIMKNTIKVKFNIGNGILVLKEHYEILKIDKTKYFYRKAVVQLDQPELCDLMNVWEAQINE